MDAQDIINLIQKHIDIVACKVSQKMQEQQQANDDITRFRAKNALEAVWQQHIALQRLLDEINGIDEA